MSISDLPKINNNTYVSIGIVVMLLAGVGRYESEIATLNERLANHVNNPSLHEKLVSDMQDKYIKRSDLEPLLKNLQEDITDIKSDLKEIKQGRR